jgi:hypothetical protein
MYKLMEDAQLEDMNRNPDDYPDEGGDVPEHE